METSHAAEHSSVEQGHIVPGIIELLQKSWELFKKQWVLAMAITLLPIIAGSVLNEIINSFDVALFSILTTIVSAIASLIGILLGLRFVRGQAIAWNNLNQMKDFWVNYVLGYIAFLFIVGVGFLLLILPGIYLATRLSFFLPLLADSKLGVMDALKKSWEMTDGKWWNLFVLYFGMGIILGLLSLVTLFIGIVVTIPVGMIASTLLYTQFRPKDLPMVS